MNQDGLQPYASENVTKMLAEDKHLKEFYNSLYNVIKDYPDLSDMVELFKKDVVGFKREYPRRLSECVAKTLDIPKSGVDILGGKPYINKTGLLYKVNKDMRKIKRLGVYPVFLPFKATVVQVPETESYKHFLGFSEDGTAMFLGVAEFNNGDMYFDYGTANAKHLDSSWGKMSTMQPYVIMLASTRASNRVIRLATSVGLCSVEEMNDKGHDIIMNNLKGKIPAEKSKLIDTIESQFKQLRWNSAKKLEFCNRFGGELIVLPEETLNKIVVELSCKILEGKQIKKTVKKSNKVSAKNETKNKPKKSNSRS